MRKILVVILFGLMGCSQGYGLDFDVSDLVKKCSNITVYDLSVSPAKEKPEFKQLAKDLCMLPIIHAKEMLDGDATLFQQEYAQIVKSSSHKPHGFSEFNVLYSFDEVMTDKVIQKCASGWFKPRHPIGYRESSHARLISLCFVKNSGIEKYWGKSLDSWLDNPIKIAMVRDISRRATAYKKEHAE